MYIFSNFVTHLNLNFTFSNDAIPTNKTVLIKLTMVYKNTEKLKCVSYSPLPVKLAYKNFWNCVKDTY